MAKKKIVKKAKSVKKLRQPVSSKSLNDEAWFRQTEGLSKAGWGFIPINWKGYVALVLLIGINVFGAQYFRLSDLILDSYLKFGVVFLVSLFVFIVIARRKTQGVKFSKNGV